MISIINSINWRKLAFIPLTEHLDPSFLDFFHLKLPKTSSLTLAYRCKSSAVFGRLGGLGGFLDSIIMPFVRGYKTHRIAKTQLQKSKKQGDVNSVPTLLLGNCQDQLPQSCELSDSILLKKRLIECFQMYLMNVTDATYQTLGHTFWCCPKIDSFLYLVLF